MSRRSKEPDEAIGPVVNGLELPLPIPAPPPEPEPEPLLPDPEFEEPVIENAVALIIGDSPIALAVAQTAWACGFDIEIAIRPGGDAPLLPEWAKIRKLSTFEDIVSDCGIKDNFYVCIFLDDADDCENILGQCLESDASYLGLLADQDKKNEIYAALRQMGAPDAELAAVCCPIGLNTGAVTPEQIAVAVAAELMATKNGTMQRLLREDSTSHA